MPELQSEAGEFDVGGGGVSGEGELAVVPAEQLAGGEEVLECGRMTVIIADGGRVKLRCTLKCGKHKMHFDAAFSREWQEWLTELY
jgi:hypothetical protein